MDRLIEIFRWVALVTIWIIGGGFEAAKEVLEYGFSELGLEKVVGLTAEQNIGSIRILEKLGFKFEQKLIFNKKKAIRYSFTRNKFQWINLIICF